MLSLLSQIYYIPVNSRLVDERLPEEYEKCLVGLTAILREAWNTSQQIDDKREKLQALSLAKECYSMKLELLTNATVVDDVIRFVEQKTKDKEMIASSCYSNEGDKRLWKFRYKLQHEEPVVKVVNRSGSDGDDGDDTLLLTWNKDYVEMDDKNFSRCD